MSQPIIEIKDLTKQYRLGSVSASSLRDEIVEHWQRLKGKAPEEDQRVFKALDSLNLEVQTGEILGIVGHNGAGKSTLLKVLSRITEPTSGEAVLRGTVASLLEVGTGFHPELSGRDNIYLSGAVLGMSRAEISRKLDQIIEFAEISRFIDTPIKRYSSGMSVRLGFAVAAHLDADILIVDEVLAVGDARFQEKCLQKIRDIQRQGRTILFVSHNSLAIENLCTRAILLEKGRLVDDGAPHAVLHNYLGSDSLDVDGRIIANTGCLSLSSLDGSYAFIDQQQCQVEIAICLRGLEAPEEFYVDVDIETEEGVRVFQLVSLPHHHVVRSTGDGEIRITYRLHCPSLRAGKYLASVYAHHPKTGVLLHVDHIPAFTATSSPEFPESRSEHYKALLTVPFEFSQNNAQ